MERREILEAALCVVGITGLSGCTVGDSPGTNGETATQETPPSETTPTPTETPVPFPETCQPLPDIEGLPALPSELTADTVETFVAEFERVYAVATNDEYGGVESLQINSVETAGERYVVTLTFEALPVTSTPDADGATPTPLPIDGYTHRAVYRLTRERMLRELRSHIDDSLFSRTCWTFEEG